MSRKVAMVIALSLFVAGLFGGIAFSSYVWSGLVQASCASTSGAETANSLMLLKLLRVGDTKAATDVLEMHLDTGLAGLGSALFANDQLRRDPTYTKFIRMARDYRAKYPNTNESHAASAAAVQKTLALADEKLK